MRFDPLITDANLNLALVSVSLFKIKSSFNIRVVLMKIIEAL